MAYRLFRHFAWHYRDVWAWVISPASLLPLLLAGLAMAAWMQLSPQLPAPSAVAASLWGCLQSGYFWPHVRATLSALLLGLAGGSALGLRSTDLHHFTLGLGDGALLLLLGGQQQLHLPFKIGDACFQRLLSCGLGKGHARRNQRDKQRGSEWPAGRFQHVSIHWDCLSPGWRTGRTGCTVAASVRGPGGGRLFAISRKQASVRPSSNKGGSAMGGGCGTLGVSASVPRQSAFIGYKCKGEGCHD